MGFTLPCVDERAVALSFRSPLVDISEGFVQAQAAGLERYQPLVVGIEAKGQVCPALADRLLLPANAIERWRMVLAGDFTPLLRRLPVRPRLVHAHFGPDGLRALPLARALGVPLVTSLRGYDVSRSRAALLRSGRLSSMLYAVKRHRLAKEGALFIAVSEAVRRRALALGFPDDRLVTHHNGVDLDRFGGQAEPREPTILHIARLVEKKGSSLLIAAFARIAALHPDATLLIVGDGPLRPRLERQVEAAGLGHRIRFLGFVEHAGIPALMRRASLLAAPSLTARDGDAEGLPNSVVEAAASALPVVATDHAGIPEAVIHGKSGWLVPEGAVAPLAEALDLLLGSATLRRQMGAEGRRLAEQRFDARVQNARLERLYDGLGAAASPAEVEPRTLTKARETV
jgi:glycosyltransferase involved in cell wall biosynthesis